MKNRLVLDIETAGKKWDDLDETSRKHLVRTCKGDATCEDQEREKLALWPVTGEVITIGMYNPDTKKAKVYFQAGGDTKEYEKDDAIYKTGTEKEILTWFWEAVRYYDQVITFNGRGFDAPWLIFRSMVHDIQPTKNLMPYRYEHREHCDLADQLSYFGSSRRFSLHLTMTALGITSPKEAGVEGADVTGMHEAGRFEEIADYCMRDVYATATLYAKWKQAHDFR